MMNRKKEIIDAIASMSGRYSSYEVFTDWIRCMAMSISNSLSMIRDRIWLEREQVYIDTMRKYSETEMIKLCEMTAWLAETLEDGPVQENGRNDGAQIGDADIDSIEDDGT